ncbi:uncharacterized protein LOC115884621 [Sitophilus oryzae]|uniref:Uncharacterized protein LOC115884621 n=1 Tax=Sitophilus oryzae TaxID=7048 RepID=A0A6J2Y7N0_SITOR|nr:uncharacterized protein LOC115884621 [Sitophilus oryzae]
MIADFDDDTHFCLKCHTTILGLDNYVTHRKSGCHKNIHPDPSKSPLPSHLLPPDEIGLKADDFFSSLELRSSSKKTTQSTSGKNFSGILTRSKTTAAIQASTSRDQTEPSQSKSGKNVWIGGSQIKDLGTGDNQSKLIKAVANLERRKDNATCHSPPRLSQVYDESDDESDEYETEEEDSEEEDYAPPRNYTGGKWKPSSPIQWTTKNENREWAIPPPSYTGGKWKPRRPPSPPPSHTKGKWKPSEDDGHSMTGGKYPPPGHTKGKWKPVRNDNEEEYTATNYTKSKLKSKAETDDDKCSPPTHTKGKWKPQNKSEDCHGPPSTHTKGKWKPSSEEMEIASPTDTKVKWKPKSEDSTVPPPYHTKGKWKPKSMSEIENSSVNITETPKEKVSVVKPKDKKETVVSVNPLKPPEHHTKGKWKPSDDSSDNIDIKSNKTKLQLNKNDNWLSTSPILDFKESDGSPFRKSNGTVQYWCSTCNRRLASKIVYERHLKSDLHFKRTRPEGEFDDGAAIRRKRIKLESESVKPPVAENKVKEPTNYEKKRKRRKIFEICKVCQSKVNKYLMGKHLISHYHCRKGDISTGAAKTMVLENIHSIILESPFQCHVCKFYCNNQEQFLEHWQSNLHKTKNQSYPGYFLCAFCKQRCEDSDSMFIHLSSPEHLEVVSVINRSVPITIKKINELSCLSCNKKFTLNIQLLNHCRNVGHNATNVNVFNKESYQCEHCVKVFYSAVSIQRHKKLKHKEDYFFCTVCNLKFKNKLEARKHRMTSAHRYATLEKRKLKGKSLRRKCEYCDEYFSNFLLLKEHLKDQHPEHKIRCPHCGTKFTVTQELTNHLRTKSCKFAETPEEDLYKCEKCPFTSNSTSELLFHVALHDEPFLEYSADTSGVTVKSKPVPKYKCPLCLKFFPKHSLQAHIRLHTQERPYACKFCSATFARKNNLLFHQKNHEKNEHIKPKKPVSDEKSFLCSTCGSGFNKKFTLQQHMLTHSGKLFRCPESDCFYTARKMSELREHFKYHSDEKNFACEICSYKGKTMKQLKQHQTVHAEEKRYRCSLCDFKSRTTSHLKRHIRLHTGAKPYNCPHCDYRCNSLENLRKHILSTTKHPGKSIYECKFCIQSPAFEANFAKDFKKHLLLEHHDTFANNKDAASYIVGIYEEQEDTSYFIDIVDDLDQPGPSSSMDPKPDSTDNILKQKTTEDPVVPQVTAPSDIASKESTLDQMLPMFIIPKDDTDNVEVTPDSWNLIGRYDVEESGTLVPFQSEEEDELFQEHF